MQQQLISKRVNQRARKSRTNKRINKQHPTSIQDLQRTPEKQSGNSTLQPSRHKDVVTLLRRRYPMSL